MEWVFIVAVVFAFAYFLGYRAGLKAPKGEDHE